MDLIHMQQLHNVRRSVHMTHDPNDNHSTMSGGDRLFMDHRLESPKHRVSLELD